MPRTPPRRPFRPALTVALCACLAACADGTGRDSTVADDALSPLPADEVILGKVYADTTQVPADFLVDATASVTSPFTLYHVKSQDLDPAAATYHELCSNDFDAALSWSDAANARRARSGVILSASETERYFEFARTLEGLDDWVGYERVFKCAYLDRDGTDLRSDGGPAGRLNREPRTAEQLKSLSEYLWQFSAHNNPGHAVLDSVGETLGSRLVHTLTMARVTPGAGANGCDLVTVEDWSLELDVDTGALSAALSEVMTLDSRLDAGLPRRCDD